jgi:hypothetical protein
MGGAWIALDGQLYLVCSENGTATNSSATVVGSPNDPAQVGFSTSTTQFTLTFSATTINQIWPVNKKWPGYGTASAYVDVGPVTFTFTSS